MQFGSNIYRESYPKGPTTKNVIKTITKHNIVMQTLLGKLSFSRNLFNMYAHSGANSYLSIKKQILYLTDPAGFQLRIYGVIDGGSTARPALHYRCMHDY